MDLVAEDPLESFSDSFGWPGFKNFPAGQAEAEQVRFVVMGVGINVNQVDFPGLPDATSLAIERGHNQDRALTLTRLIQAVEAVQGEAITQVGVAQSVPPRLPIVQGEQVAVPCTTF